MANTPVVVEVTPKRAFASAVEWPGWSRGGRDAEAAAQSLRDYAARYAPVPNMAGLEFLPGDFSLELVDGSGHTDFGVPGAIVDGDREPVGAAGVERLLGLVAASFQYFDATVDSAPAELRKGPRGGGRDRDRILHHVLETEATYAGLLNTRLKMPDPGDRAAVGAFRTALLEVLREAAARPAPGPEDRPRRWPFRYAARRIAWHALDHAWEIEDRTER